MNEVEQYQKLITEIIAKQVLILGPEIAISRAKNVPTLEISTSGEVMNIKGDPRDALKRLIDEYVELSGMIVKNALGSIFEKYPSIQRIE